MSLYRNFTTVEELDAQYDIEASVPDFGVYVDQFVGQSSAARADLTTELDVSYGPTVDETYDVFSDGSSSSGPKPLLYFVHGGYWKATTSKEWSYVAAGLARRGFVVVVENYALAPGVSIAEIVRQHRASFAAVWHRAAELNIDTERIVVAGHSAGGHAGAMLLATDWDRYGLPAQPFAGALLVSGVFDLRPLPRTFLAPYLGLDSGDAVELSPQLALPASIPPVSIVHGNKETDEFARQSIDYAAALRAAGFAVDYTELDANHFDILDHLADGTGFLAQEVLRLTAG